MPTVITSGIVYLPHHHRYNLGNFLQNQKQSMNDDSTGEILWTNNCNKCNTVTCGYLHTPSYCEKDWKIRSNKLLIMKMAIVTSFKGTEQNGI